jgi:aspartate 1-decarboxylase
LLKFSVNSTHNITITQDKSDTIKGIKIDINIMDLFSLKNFTKISIFILAGKKLGKYQLPPKPQRKELMIVNNDKANNINIKLKIKHFIKLFLYEQALTK